MNAPDGASLHRLRASGTGPRVAFAAAVFGLAGVLLHFWGGPFLGAAPTDPAEQARLVMRWHATGCPTALRSAAVEGEGLAAVCEDGSSWRLTRAANPARGCGLGIWAACWGVPEQAP